GTRSQEVWMRSRRKLRQARSCCARSTTIGGSNERQYGQLASRTSEGEHIKVSSHFGSRNHSSRDAIRTKYARLDFPYFDGDNPKGLIYRCKQFFSFNNITE
ncbi:unnamed protein product, partial [Ilex paraguariensis]